MKTIPFPLIFWIFVAISVVYGEPPLYQREAFNRITLTEAEGAGAFDVFPLDFPDGRKPAALPTSGEITIRFIEYPMEEFLISWSAVAKIETFNELVFEELLTKQAELMQKITALPQIPPGAAPREVPGDDSLKASLEELYGYYDYLSQSHDPPRGLTEPYRQFLLGEAIFFGKHRDWVNAIARLERLYAERKDYPGLAENWGRIFNDLLKDVTEAEDYQKARDLIRRFLSYYPDHPIARRWETAYSNRAQKLFEESKQSLQAGDFATAAQKNDEAAAIWPKLVGLREHAEMLHEKYPGITVGVSETTPASADSPPSLFYLANIHSPLAAQRQHRLIARDFVEQVGYEVEGGKYASPFGEISRDNYGQLLRLKLPDNARVGAVEVAESLLRLIEPEKNLSASLWRSEFGSVDIEESDRLSIRFQRRQVLPESLFRVPIFRSPFDGTAPLPTDGTGPFIRRAGQEKSTTTVFQFNEGYAFPFGTGPKIVRELPITDFDEGLKLLEQNKILAIDRVAPWEIANRPELAEKYTVGRYTTPTVHFLIPNRKRPLPGSRTFRRALLYGLNRQQIVRQMNGPNGSGAKPNGVEVISGVAPKGSSDVDPIGYGCDPLLAPRLYDPKLAVALILMSLSHARDKNLLLEEEQPKKKRILQLAADMPEIVIAHPDNPASLTAVQMIWRQWESIGIPVRLVPYDPAEPIGRGRRVDFWFVACPVSEPMFDVRAILSGDGLVGSSSVYMDLALKKLEEAEEWVDVAKELRAIHKLSFEETTVLPLWQYKDCYLFRKELSGATGRDSLPAPSDSLPSNELLHFYQNVEHWTVPFTWDAPR